MFGQSVWLDYIRRNLFTTGELARLVKEDGLRGMTSNPAIFEKAIAGSTDYAQELQELAKRKDLDAKGVYEQLAIHDIQKAADVLRPVYDGVEAPRRLREPGSFARPRAQDAGDHRGSAPAVESGRPRKPDDQGSRHRRGNSGVSAADQRRHQRQRHAAFRAGRVRASRRGLHRGSRRFCEGRRGRQPHGQRRELLREPHRHVDREHDRRTS